jgi:hypothetical protein
LDLLGAVLVPAILEGTVWRLVSVHSVGAIVLKEWCLSVPIAAFMGFMMYRSWRSATSKWVWIPLAFWFGLRALPFIFRPHARGVLGENSGFWSHFSGAACSVDISHCLDFLVFSVPLIRGLSYSIAALLASKILKPWSRADAKNDSTTTGDENLTHA